VGLYNYAYFLLYASYMGLSTTLALYPLFLTKLEETVNDPVVSNWNQITINKNRLTTLSGCLPAHLHITNCSELFWSRKIQFALFSWLPLALITGTTCLPMVPPLSSSWKGKMRRSSTSWEIGGKICTLDLGVLRYGAHCDPFRQLQYLSMDLNGVLTSSIVKVKA
jgi:hypothetical protein